MNRLIDLLARHGLPALLEFTHALVVLVRPDGTPLEWNPAFGRLKESRTGLLVVQDLLTSDDRSLFNESVHAALDSKSPARSRWELLIGKNREACDCMLIPLPDGQLLFLAEPVPGPQDEESVRLAGEVQQLKREVEKWQANLALYKAQFDEVAHTDPLTFVSNHRQIVGDLQREVFHAARYKTPLTISMVDIDHFKQVNDKFGHQFGDKVLWALADTLQEGIRQSDIIGRYGGEEFLILLPGTPIELAIGQAERLLQGVREMALDAEGQPVHLAISIGIAEYHIGQETWEEFLNRADKALYQAKEGGRDQWSAGAGVKLQGPPPAERRKKSGSGRRSTDEGT